MAVIRYCTRMPIRKRLLFAGLRLSMTSALLVTPWPGQEPAVRSEYRVKAAVLYNIVKFVEWSPAKDDEHEQIVFGVLGKDPFGHVLDDTIRNKTVNGRPLTVQRFVRVQDAKASMVLFISSSERRHLQDIMHALAGTRVLTVAEIEDFGKLGGMINLVIDKERVGLEINVEASSRAGIKISSRLLQLAKIVASESLTAKP